MTQPREPVRVCLINGSLRGRRAASLAFLQDVNRRLGSAGCRTSIVTVRADPAEGYPRDMLEDMGSADALVFVFPLYSYGLPGALMRLLEDYYRYVQTGHPHPGSAKVYAVINCGFPRPEAVTGEAVRVMQNFCRRVDLDWRFAVRIGTGPVVALTRRVPFLDLKLKHAFRALAADAVGGGAPVHDDFFVHPVIPEPVIRRIKEHYEKKGGMIASGDTA